MGATDPSGYMSDSVDGSNTDSFEGEEVTWSEVKTYVGGGGSGGTPDNSIGNGNHQETGASTSTQIGNEPQKGAAIPGGDDDNDGVPDSEDYDELNESDVVIPVGTGGDRDGVIGLGPGPMPPLKGASQNPPVPKSARKQISTGRTEPANLKEKLAIEEVISNPSGVTPPRMPKMSDTKNKLLHEDGWVKRTQNVNGVEVHYVENIKTGEVVDFKFAD